MNNISFSKARKVEFKFAINAKQSKRFIITLNGEDVPSVAGWTWEFVIKKNKGNREKIISLTLGNGLSYEAYSSYTLVATFEAAQTNIAEGEYFAALWRTDIPEPWIWGQATFKFGDFDSDL